MSVRTAEHQRLEEDRQRRKHWKRWGPYLSERAWGTVREDYSAGGTAWEYFPHDHARSRAYRWNEALPASVIAISESAWPSRCGTAAIPFSKNGSLV